MGSFSDQIRRSVRVSEAEPAAPVLAIIGLAERDDGAVASVLISLRKVVRTLPGLMLAYLAAGILAVIVGFGSDLSWLGSVLLVGAGPALLTLCAYAVLHARAAAAIAPSRRVLTLVAFAVLLGGMQGLAFGGAFAHPGDPWMLGGIVAMASVATLAALAALPVTAAAYLFAFVLAGLIAAGKLVYLPGSVLLFVALLPVGVALVRADRFELRRRAREQKGGSKAGALIAMFEDSGKVWFWETDRHGKLTYTSSTLAAMFGKTPSDLIGRPLTDLIMAGGDEDLESPQGERTISFYLSTRLGFSELPMRANLPQEARWFTVTGKPVIDAVGQFRGFRGTGTDFTEKRRSEAEISRLARFDSLTGLPNRGVMLQTLEQALGNARINPAPCALMLLDLDRFKNVNDTLGHPVGDALLKLVAKRLEAVIGDKGRVGRLGGDEFNVVLPVAPSLPEIARIASEIIMQLSQPYTIEGSHVTIGTSIGIATGPTDGDTADALVRNADLALYAAKAGGKGVHRFYRAEMHSDAKERRVLELDLRRALAENGLHVVYQPVVCANAETIVGFEALARWTHPVRGPISPEKFIPVAEEIGLIQIIGEWVLRTACLEAANWPPHVRVAVNVSPAQFANLSFPSVVLNALATSNLDPARLELEITESVFLHEGADTDATFAKLKGIGVRLALDDFGTGYSALGYLRKAPFDKIKIDRSFVQGATVEGNRNAAIIKAIVSLADSLGMDTTAEGAETMDELAMIRSLGCSHIQGYIFGVPMLASDARAKVSGAIEPVAAEGFQRSRAPRIAMLRTATLRHDTRIIPVRIRNISSSGAQIEVTELVPDGSDVRLDLGTGTLVDAIVRWSQGGRMGIAFARTIDVAQVAATKPIRRAVG